LGFVVAQRPLRKGIDLYQSSFVSKEKCIHLVVEGKEEGMNE
jgi:hypothetical protein